MKIEVGARIRMSGLEPYQLGSLRGTLSLMNPKFIEAERIGRRTWGIKRMLRFYENSNGHLIAPRGFVYQAAGYMKQFGPVEFADNRRVVDEVDFGWKGEDRQIQTEAVDTMLNRDHGTLIAPTGSGKTVMGLRIASLRRQPFAVVVHTKELLYQWRERATAFLDIDDGDISLIGDGHKPVAGKNIYIGLVQSMKKMWVDVEPHVGHLIVDECHRAPSKTFTEVVSRFRAKYLLGLTATPTRRDGLNKVIFWTMGPGWYQIDEKTVEKQGDIVPANVIRRTTSFISSYDPTEEYTSMLKELVLDPTRNDQIAADVRGDFFRHHGTILVLTDRIDHARILSNRIKAAGVRRTVELTGRTKRKVRAGIIKSVEELNIDCIVATGQLIGEGFDCPHLDAVFLTTPIKYHGRLTQYIGRVLRPSEGKEKARIYDYVDANIHVLNKSWMKRRATYRRRGWVA